MSGVIIIPAMAIWVNLILGPLQTSSLPFISTSTQLVLGDAVFVQPGGSILDQMLDLKMSRSTRDICIHFTQV